MQVNKTNIDKIVSNESKVVVKLPYQVTVVTVKKRCSSHKSIRHSFIMSATGTDATDIEKYMLSKKFENVMKGTS